MLSSLGQSAAALFSPESERLRAKEQNANDTNLALKNNPFRVPGSDQLNKGDKSQDSLGNPASPGYEFMGRKTAQQEQAAIEAKKEADAKAARAPAVIYLQCGWEKLLFAQKKIGEKAKTIFQKLEGPLHYNYAKRNKLVLLKSRGSILNHKMEQEIPKDPNRENQVEKKIA